MEPITTYINVANLPDEILTGSPGLSNAVPDDGRDDAEAIQAAIDWVALQQARGAAQSTTIYLPEGTFDLGETLKIDTPGLTLEGAGGGLTLLRNADGFQVGIEALSDRGVNLDTLNREAYLFDLGENADGVTFANMALTGPELHGAVFGFGSDNLEIRDVEFNNFAWSSVRLFNLSGAKIHGNRFVDAGGQANGTSGQSGGSIYGTFLRDSEIDNNVLSRSGDREGNVYGIKGRKFSNVRIHHNTINTNFSIELPFENDDFVEIDHNFLDGVVSIPKFGGGPVPDGGFTFHIHHNYFTSSYSLEWTRNGAEIDHNVFDFSPEEDRGNLISSFGQEKADGPTAFHNNFILNPGRGVFWSRGIYNNFSFYNNEIIANETETPRTEGLFGFSSETDFSTVSIRDNVIRVNGLSRPLFRNENSANANIENNTLSNISDADSFDNLDTGAPRGLLEPLLFQVGVDGEFTVDSSALRASAEDTSAESTSAVVTSANSSWFSQLFNQFEIAISRLRQR
ncbi:MAG: glycosyl hydrolase family 28-related protein [Elainellaceae cyanobacterium]